MNVTPFINPTSFAPAKFGDVSSLLNLVLPLVSLGAVLVFLFMMLRASFTILTGGGVPEQVVKAQKMFMFAALGLGVVLASFIIVKLIGVILNIPNLPL